MSMRRGSVAGRLPPETGLISAVWNDKCGSLDRSSSALRYRTRNTFLFNLLRFYGIRVPQS